MLMLPKNYEPYAVIQALDVIKVLDFVPDVLIDCGPGYGVEAHQFKAMFPGIKIVGFEPCANVYREIMDEYPGSLLNTAINDKGYGLCSLYGNGMGATLKRPMDELVHARVIVSDNLDSIEDLENMRCGFLWADVEGSEREVLGGAKELITAGKIKGLNLEVHDGEDERLTDALCAELGFRKVMSYAGNGAHHDNVYLFGR